MRKYSLILSAVAVTGLTVAAKAAPETTLFLDSRDNSAGAQSITTPAAPFTIGQGDFPNDGPAGGGKGNGQVLRVSPTIGGPAGALITGAAKYPNFDGDANASTASLWLYADVGDDTTAAGAGDVISSIGIDMTIGTSATTPRYDIATVSWAWTLVDPSVPVNYGFANGTSSRTGVVGAKYVKVPVSGASVYATAGGLTPPAVGTTMYQLGRLQIAGAARDVATPGTCGNTGNTNAHATASTYNLSMKFNNLLMTRTFSNVVADTDERVSLGYFGGVVDADQSGNVPNVASTNRDAIIQVRMKNDANGSGHVNGFDIPGFVAAQAAGAGISQSQRYLYDNVAPANVNGFDIPVFTAYQTAPCP